MMFELPTDFRWLPPWSAIEGDERTSSLADELRREMPAGHPLKGCKVKAIGQSDRHPDDVLFATDCASQPLAFVHLTWSVEFDPDWPFTEMYRTLEDWVVEMASDSEEFAREQNEKMG